MLSHRCPWPSVIDRKVCVSAPGQKCVLLSGYECCLSLLCLMGNLGKARGRLSVWIKTIAGNEQGDSACTRLKLAWNILGRSITCDTLIWLNEVGFPLAQGISYISVAFQYILSCWIQYLTGLDERQRDVGSMIEISKKVLLTPDKPPASKLSVRHSISWCSNRTVLTLRRKKQFHCHFPHIRLPLQ